MVSAGTRHDFQNRGSVSAGVLNFSAPGAQNSAVGIVCMACLVGSVWVIRRVVAQAEHTDGQGPPRALTRKGKAPGPQFNFSATENAVL